MAPSVQTTGQYSNGQKAQYSQDEVKKGLASEDLTKDYPPRFADLKKQLWKDEVSQSWVEVLKELEAAAERISKHGTDASTLSIKISSQNGTLTALVVAHPAGHPC